MTEKLQDPYVATPAARTELFATLRQLVSEIQAVGASEAASTGGRGAA